MSYFNFLTIRFCHCHCQCQWPGVQDTRFQALMPDPLHFLGVTKIHNFISMSDMKYNAIVSTGIKIENRVEIPPGTSLRIGFSCCSDD